MKTIVITLILAVSVLLPVTAQAGATYTIFSTALWEADKQELATICGKYERNGQRYINKLVKKVSKKTPLIKGNRNSRKDAMKAVRWHCTWRTY